MSRYPYIQYSERFLEANRFTLAECTIKTQRNRYRRQNKDFQSLHDQGLVSSMSPLKMTPEDVAEYLSYRLSLGLSAKEQSHDISALRALFEYVGNDAVSDCIRANPRLLQHGRTARLPPMADPVYETICRRSAEVQLSDPRRCRAYALVLLTVCTGLRTKEVRLADIDDLDIDNWTLRVIHVKGEDSYGEPREVPIHPDARPAILRYLESRATWLMYHDTVSAALFPSVSSEDGHLSANTLRKIKIIVEKDCGQKFDFRTLRRTFGQRYLDAGCPVEAVSRVMGHATTVTTEKYYCRISDKDAQDAIRGSWSSKKGVY